MTKPKGEGTKMLLRWKWISGSEQSFDLRGQHGNIIDIIPCDGRGKYMIEWKEKKNRKAVTAKEVECREN